MNCLMLTTKLRKLHVLRQRHQCFSQHSPRPENQKNDAPPPSWLWPVKKSQEQPRSPSSVTVAKFSASNARRALPLAHRRSLQRLRSLRSGEMVKIEVQIEFQLSQLGLEEM